jgi:hypothetical protein
MPRSGLAWRRSKPSAVVSKLREQSLRQQLGEEQTRAAALATQNRQPSEAARAPLVAALVLVPGLSRAQARSSGSC